MAWSSILERRYVSPTARIVVDLACPGCGYNLRGLRALGACPECGAAASAVLADARAAIGSGGAARSFARSSVTTLLAAVVSFAGWANPVAALLLLLGGALRLIAATQLRCHVAGIDGVLHRRAGHLRKAAAAETALAAMALLLMVAGAWSGHGALVPVASAAAFLLMSSSAAGLAAAALFARAALALRAPDRIGSETIAGVAIASAAMLLLLGAGASWALAQARSPSVPVDPWGSALLIALGLLALASVIIWALMLLAAIVLGRTSLDPADVVDEPLVTGGEAVRRAEALRLSEGRRMRPPQGRSPGPVRPPC
ncbi:MAG TPA: hypothetical protein PKC43_05130 [Phycisphaerales bacterium]|nr:hypothetical protein [Phycisphaerales bacterium]HMP36813.1 hypothetical protein [Phycisphaerales bacterium]